MTALLFLIWLGIVVLSQSPSPDVHLFNQTLDHFNPQNSVTFIQRYFTCDKYYKSEHSTLSTIFFYCGGEGDLEGFWNNIGFPFDIASQFNAFIVFAEHRYYGQSLPNLTQYPSASYFRYLSMEQAIADFASIMRYIKNNHTHLRNSPVIAFGGSYGGVLSALLRVHYPSQFHIAVSSSAPWLQLMNRGSPTKYFEIVTNDYNRSDAKCPPLVRKGFAQMYAQYVSHNNYEELQSIFNTCDAIDADNVDNFINWIRNAFAVFAQSDYPYETTMFGTGMPAWPVEFVCKNILLHHMDQPLHALSMVTQFYYNNVSHNNALDCLNVSELFPYCSDHCWCGTGANAVAWNYQKCTEIIVPTNTNNVSDMFPPSVWELDDISEFCQRKFNDFNVIPNPEWDAIWQPMDIAKVGKYIIWSNGMLDPWGGGGFTTNFTDNEEMIVFLIPDAAHHYDLRFANKNDTKYVVEVRKREVGFVWKWLSEYFTTILPA
eukprot:40684_1